MKNESDLETEEEMSKRACAVCGDNHQSPSSLISTCSYCRLRVHQDCYGLIGTEHPYFCCDRCSNIRDPEISLDYQCVLCPTDTPAKYSAMKRTIGNNWAHMNCAVWIPEVKFGNSEKMDMTEGIGRIDFKKWNNVSFLQNLTK